MSHSPKISLPSSGSSGKEATGPSPQLLLPALGPGQEQCRVAARMNKPGSSGKGSEKKPPAAGLAGDGLRLSGVAWLPCTTRGQHAQWDSSSAGVLWGTFVLPRQSQPQAGAWAAPSRAFGHRCGAQRKVAIQGSPDLLWIRAMVDAWPLLWG